MIINMPYIQNQYLAHLKWIRLDVNNFRCAKLPNHQECYGTSNSK